jgi:hypothetical protein
MSHPATSTMLDLAHFSEDLRRRLYHQVSEMHFARPDSRHTPDQAGLQVFYAAGRWFASWIDLDEPATLHDRLRVRIARIAVDAEETSAIELHEV